MLFSNRKEFFFVHNYKVAGNTIKSLLEDYSPWYQKSRYRKRFKQINDIFRNFLPEQWLFFIPYYRAHLKAREIRKKFPVKFENYFTFGFVRNPWDWQVSLYSYMLQTEDHFQHELVKSFDGFEEYIKWRVEEDLNLQKDFFSDDNGVIIVDHIGKMENLKSELEMISKKLDIELSENIPKKNQSQHRDYKKYYNTETKKLVAQNFKEDINEFNYSFE